MRIQATVDATLGSPDEVEAVRAFVETKMRLGPWGTPRSSSAAEQDDGGAAEPPPPPLPVGGAGDERDLVQALIEQGAVYRLRRFRRIDKQVRKTPRLFLDLPNSLSFLRRTPTVRNFGCRRVP